MNKKEWLHEVLRVSKKVYECLEDDGVYGPYTLGAELWEEFKTIMILETPTNEEE